MLLSQIGSGPLTVPGNCIHIFLQGGFWDPTEPETQDNIVLLADVNTSLRGTARELSFFPLPEPLFLGDGRPLNAFSFFNA